MDFLTYDLVVISESTIGFFRYKSINYLFQNNLHILQLVFKMVIIIIYIVANKKHPHRAFSSLVVVGRHWQ